MNWRPTVGRVDRVLPTVLANTGIGESDITTSVSRGLYKDLGYEDATKAPQDVQRAVAAVVEGLNKAQDGGKGIDGISTK